MFRKLKDSSKAYRKIHIYLNVEIPDIPAVGGQAEHPVHLLALNKIHKNVMLCRTEVSENIVAAYLQYLYNS